MMYAAAEELNALLQGNIGTIMKRVFMYALPAINPFFISRINSTQERDGLALQSR